MANNSWVYDGIDSNGRYKFSYTADQASTTSVLLETQNKFVDRNILIQSTVAAANLKAGDGAVSINVLNASLLGSSASTAPSSGPYIKIEGYGTVSVTSSTTGGWINAGTTQNSNTATIYYPVKVATFKVSDNVVYCETAGYVAAGSSTTPVGTITTVTPSTTYANTGMSTYFNEGSSSNKDVTITPLYKNSAGYVAAHTSWTNNGGIGYWKIKTTSVSTVSTVVSNSAISTAAQASWGTGWISANSISAVTFSNTFAAGKTDASYVDISETNSAPILTSGGFLYINAGYTDDIKISLAKLVPDTATIIASATGTSNKILSGESAYDEDGALVTGTIPSLAATQYTPTTTNLTIAVGYYISGVLTIKGDANLVAGNIKSGVDIFGITGTFTNTPSGKTALTAAALRSGYAGFINGTQVNGSMPNTSASTTFTATNIGTYFTAAASGATTGSISIVPKYSVETAGYIPVTSNSAGTTLYYNIKTGTLTANSGAITLKSDNTAQNSTTPSLPFSIYGSDTHGITIVTATTTAVMGSNKVYIKVEGSGQVKCSTTGWIVGNTTAASTTTTKYIAMNYYTGSYSIP